MNQELRHPVTAELAQRRREAKRRRTVKRQLRRMGLKEVTHIYQIRYLRLIRRAMLN